MLEKSKRTKVDNLCDLLVDASIDRVLAIDTEWNIIAWNRTSENISGIEEANIMGKPLLKVFPALENDQEYMQALHDAMDGKKSFLLPNQEFEHRIFYENHLIPLKNNQGLLVGVMNLMHDVSHRIMAEQQLQQLNASLKIQYERLEKANAELAIFTSITSKDLKEPVKKIYTGLEMLVQADGKKLSDNSKAGLRRMQASLTKMNLMLDDILGFSSASNYEGKFETVELDEVLQNVLLALQSRIAGKQVAIEAGQLPSYTGSKEMLFYLFYNLVDNALKFREQGSATVIKIDSIVIPANHRTPQGGAGNTDFLCITFTDNGIGFAAEDNKRIFNMFERLHPRKQFSGAGIGLAISKKITEAHGGYIEAESSVGNGAVFKCYLQLK